LRITGLYRLADPASPYWGIDLIARSGISSQPPYVSYGPAVASPAAFGRGGLTVGQVSWIALPSVAGIRGRDLAGLAGQISRTTAALQGTTASIEIRAEALAVFFAVAQIFGAIGPAFYGVLIGNGSSRAGLTIGYLVGGGIMIIGGLVEIAFGINAEGKPLEEIAAPLTMAGA
jgi:hypothetical protein